jgi:hypothetical protein
MRFFASFFALASLALAAPVTELSKRAAAGDVANIGYALSSGQVYLDEYMCQYLTSPVFQHYWRLWWHHGHRFDPGSSH